MSRGWRLKGCRSQESEESEEQEAQMQDPPDYHQTGYLHKSWTQPNLHPLDFPPARRLFSSTHAQEGTNWREEGS